MSNPMTPGSKSDTSEDVIDLAWNNEGRKRLNIITKLLSIMIVLVLREFCNL